MVPNLFLFHVPLKDFFKYLNFFFCFKDVPSYLIISL